MDYPEVTDENNNVIRIGDHVNTSGEIGFESMPRSERIRITERWNWDSAAEGDRERYRAPVYQRTPDGIVVAISDWDGDVDEEGRTIGISPSVGVRWPGDGEIDWYKTNASYRKGGYYDDIDVECDDLIVLYRDHNNERG